MKNLETLIQELCPDGVEFVKLGDVCEIKTGKGITQKDCSESSKYPVYSGGKEPMGYYKEFNRNANSVTVSRVGAYAGFVNYVTEDFYLNDKCFSVLPKKDEDINSKYLYYKLKALECSIINMQSGGGVPTINTKKVGSLEIPLPPIEVQTEIVRILDKFTSLEAELEAELDCRKRQYEYYRDKLLSFENVEGQEVEWKKLNDIVIFKNGKGHEKSIVDEGKYIIVNSKFVSTNGMVRKYSDVQLCPLYKDSILMVMSDLPNGRALAKCFLVDKDDLYTLNQRVGSFVVNDNKVVVKFLFYILNRNRQLLQYDNGVDQTNLRKSDILNILIPIPSLAEQHRIVSILDRFESLTTSLQSGLPAEIAARRQQYEHYRDKLLTFKRKGAA